MASVSSQSPSVEALAAAPAATTDDLVFVQALTRLCVPATGSRTVSNCKRRNETEGNNASLDWNSPSGKFLVLHGALQRMAMILVVADDDSIGELLLKTVGSSVHAALLA